MVQSAVPSIFAQTLNADAMATDTLPLITSIVGTEVGRSVHFGGLQLSWGYRQIFQREAPDAEPYKPARDGR